MQKLNGGQILSSHSLVHSSLKAHCSYSLKFFVVKNHLRNRSLSNCSLLGSRSCSTRPSQRSKYTEGVGRCMRRCTAVQRLSRKYSHARPKKKKTPFPVRDVVLLPLHCCEIKSGSGLGTRLRLDHSRAECLDPEVVEEYFKLLKKTLEESCLYNCDETLTVRGKSLSL